MRTITVGTVEEYGDAVAEVLDGGDELPVLRPFTSALPPLEGDDPAGPAGSEPGQVLGFGPTEWAHPARLHAWLNGREFGWFAGVGALVTAAAGGRGPLTVCAPPEQTTGRTVWWHSTHTAEKGSHQRPTAPTHHLPPQRADRPALHGKVRTLRANRRNAGSPRPDTRRARRVRSTPMGDGHGQTAPQDPGGLRRLPRPHPRDQIGQHVHGVITGEPRCPESGAPSNSAPDRPHRGPRFGRR
ncbi:hypothetical protein ATK36_4301 [Amycolatopsis sulphurea]|uniref:Uncharacterized protein n=1 Tax=Amycolatopsis sulphurea TaxID=76022 RepID=A0A2A9FCL2_9PSEU|nr:hypothetical protein ATK36_4301 [Amycolatopsis sulphurea]